MDADPTYLIANLLLQTHYCTVQPNFIGIMQYYILMNK